MGLCLSRFQNLRLGFTEMTFFEAQQSVERSFRLFSVTLCMVVHSDNKKIAEILTVLSYKAGRDIVESEKNELIRYSLDLSYNSI